MTIIYLSIHTSSTGSEIFGDITQPANYKEVGYMISFAQGSYDSLYSLVGYFF